MKGLEHVQYYSEDEMDERMQKGKFFRIRQFPETAEGQRKEEQFFDEQSNLIAELEHRVQAVYGERVFVSDNVWASEKLKIEIGSNDVTASLFRLLLHFLLEKNKHYCIGLSISQGSLQDAGSDYLGRILTSGRGIAVEDSLKAFFQERFIDPLRNLEGKG
jgi:hypothetical protein